MWWLQSIHNWRCDNLQKPCDLVIMTSPAPGEGRPMDSSLKTYCLFKFGQKTWRKTLKLSKLSEHDVTVTWEKVPNRLLFKRPICNPKLITVLTKGCFDFSTPKRLKRQLGEDLNNKLLHNKIKFHKHYSTTQPLLKCVEGIFAQGYHLPSATSTDFPIVLPFWCLFSQRSQRQ